MFPSLTGWKVFRAIRLLWAARQTERPKKETGKTSDKGHKSYADTHTYMLFKHHVNAKKKDDDNREVTGNRKNRTMEIYMLHLFFFHCLSVCPCWLCSVCCPVTHPHMNNLSIYQTKTPLNGIRYVCVFSFPFFFSLDW